jgi:NAD(P)-dependent dehydrogenase (short-subunit alcohol dehydrogenase family)
VRALVPDVVAHFGQIDAVVNSASTFEQDDASTFGFAALEKHLRANTGALHLATGAACSCHGSAGQRRGGQPAGPEAWNQNPDFLSYITSKADGAGSQHHAGHGASPAVRVVGVAPGLTRC